MVTNITNSYNNFEKDIRFRCENIEQVGVAVNFRLVIGRFLVH